MRKRVRKEVFYSIVSQWAIQIFPENFYSERKKRNLFAGQQLNAGFWKGIFYKETLSPHVSLLRTTVVPEPKEERSGDGITTVINSCRQPDWKTLRVITHPFRSVCCCSLLSSLLPFPSSSSQKIRNCGKRLSSPTKHLLIKGVLNLVVKKRCYGKKKDWAAKIGLVGRRERERKGQALKLQTGGVKRQKGSGFICRRRSGWGRDVYLTNESKISRRRRQRPSHKIHSLFRRFPKKVKGFLGSHFSAVSLAGAVWKEEETVGTNFMLPFLSKRCPIYKLSANSRGDIYAKIKKIEITSFLCENINVAPLTPRLS